MRGCGLRIEEALAVSKEEFIEGDPVLRVMWQASGNGRDRVPLKHRKRGEYRDVPVPSWLWAMVKDLPDGPLMPGLGGKPQRYGTIYFRFTGAARTGPGHARVRAGPPDSPHCSSSLGMVRQMRDSAATCTWWHPSHRKSLLSRVNHVT
jgi:integrase